MDINLRVHAMPGATHTAFLLGNTVDRDGRKILAHACHKPGKAFQQGAPMLARALLAKSRRIGHGPAFWQRLVATWTIRAKLLWPNL